MNIKDSGIKKVSNPPFKPFIDYRIGDYNTFRKVMLSLIKKNALLAGTSMSKSDKRDYGGALVDMWAYLCDILTYYQERLASESFLRTARLEESVIELLYLVDYLPPRGRSASALVRFVADEKKVPPKEPGVIIPQGFKIASVPAKGQEEAVIFETDESLVINSDHNLMKIDGWRTSYKIEQGTTQLFLDKIYPEINVGDLVMFSDDNNFDVVRIIKKVDKNGKSQIEWTEDKALRNDYTLSKAKIQKFTQLVRPFGYNAPPSILSNVGVTLYKKKSDSPVGSKDDNNNRSEDERDRVANRLAQLVDASDRVVASATSDSDGKLMFKGLIPGSYRIFIARSASITEESQLYPIITAIPSNHFQLLPGFESWFDAELEFGVGGGGGPIVDSFVNTLKQLSRLLQENPFAEKGLNLAGTTNIPFLPQILERIADDAQSDTRPGLTLVANEPYPFDPVGADILSSQVYLDKVYENIEQGSFVILSKDDPSNQIDTSRQLFKISRTSQMFHAKYGIGGNSSAVTLQTIVGKDGQEEEFIFCWEEILEELKGGEKGRASDTDGKTERDVPGKETEQLINFLNEDVNALDAEKDIPVIDENETAIQISDQIKKNVYRIELNEKDKGKATLFKNGKRLLDFVVKIEKVRGEEEEGEEAAKIKTNLYANKIESAFYEIRNTMIFTNPVMEIGVDPRFASQDKTDQNAENITLEGMHTGLKAGIFLAVTDNTSIIQGRVVDSDLHPLEGYRVAVYRVKKLPTSSSSSSSSSTSIPLATAPIEVTFARTNADGYFSFNDLRADSYVLSLSLPLEKYWQIFVNYILEEVGVKKPQGRHVEDDDNGGGQRNEKREIINALLFPEHRKIVSNHPTNGTRSNSSKEKDEGLNLTEFAKHHLSAFVELIAIIRRKDELARPANLESRFAAYIEDILRVISEVETSIKVIVLPLIDAGSDERSSSSSTSSSSLLNKSLADCIKIIEKEPEAKLKQLRSRALLVLDRLPNERLTTSSSFVREFIEETIIPVISILEEILIVAKESLQSPFRSTIYQKNELLLGTTKTLDLESDTATNITMKFNMKDRLTYVESMLQSSKLQVTKIAGVPSFSEGKTHLSLDPPLNYRYVKGFAEIYGNMVPASHGETVKDEILGSGDASIIHQEFTIRKGPISIVPSPLSPNGIKSTLKVIVNDVLWQETDDFLDSEPNDQHYVTSLNEDGSIKIVFGDGIRGSTLPTGIDNVHAQYRVGMGFRGNLPPNAPVVPKEKNPAIKSVSIPAGSYGGAEKVLSQQKRSYRPRILTLGRAVSLEDYSNLAKTFGEISKARSYLIMKDGLETVVLIVAGHRGRIVSSALQMELQAYMDERRDIRIPLQIESFVPVPVDLVVEVKVNDSYRRSKVVSNIESRLGPGTQYDNYRDSNDENENYDDQHQRGSGGKVNISGDSRSGGNGSAIGRSKEDRDLSEHYDSLFSFERLDFGQKVTLNDVYAVVENVHGVDFAVVRKFCRRSGGGNGCNGGTCDTTTVQEVISANHNEILQCENDPLDPIKGTIKVVARGGLEI